MRGSPCQCVVASQLQNHEEFLRRSKALSADDTDRVMTPWRRRMLARARQRGLAIMGTVPPKCVAAPKGSALTTLGS